MEPIIINKCVRDKKVLKDFYFYHIFLRPIPLVCGILLALIAVTVIPPAFKGNGYAIAWIAIVALYVCYKILQYRMSVKYIFERECKLNQGKPLEVTLELYDGMIIQKTPLTPDLRIPYITVKKVRRWHSQVYIINRARQAFILRDTDYIKGSYKELKSLLNSKLTDESQKK